MELKEDSWIWHSENGKYKQFLSCGQYVTGGYDGKAEEQDEKDFYNILGKIIEKIFKRFAEYDYESYKILSPAITYDGKKMQNDFATIFKNKEYYEYVREEREIFSGYRVHDFKWDFSKKSANINRKLRLFIGSNFYDVLGAFYVKNIKDKNTENFMKFINEEISPKYNNIVEKLYNVYINNYSNVDRYNIYTLCDMFCGNRILNTDILELQKKYSNLKEEDMLTLCLYKMDDEMFYGYLNLLNSKSEEDKGKIFEIIKPLSYYYQYLPSNSEIENFTKYDEKEAFSAKTAEMIQDYLRTQDLSNYKLHDYHTSRVDISYCGKIYYISTFQNIFLNQLDALTQMTDDELDQLLQIKEIIVNNPQNTQVHCHEETYKVHDDIYHEEYFNYATGSWDSHTVNSPYYSTRDVYTIGDAKTKKALSYLNKYFKTYAFTDREINNDVIREYIKIMINSVFLTMVPEKAKELIKKL